MEDRIERRTADGGHGRAIGPTAQCEDDLDRRYRRVGRDDQQVDRSNGDLHGRDGLDATFAEEGDKAPREERRPDVDGDDRAHVDEPSVSGHNASSDRDSSWTRVVVVEDHGLTAETVAAALRTRGIDARVVDARVVEDLVTAVVVQAPDVVLLDLDLGPGRDGLELLPAMRDAGLTVLMMTGITEPARLARCVRSGAVGVVGKGCGFDDLVRAVAVTLDRGTLLTRHEREEHLSALRRHEQAEFRRLGPFRDLTSREAEVLEALCRGESVDDIARSGAVAVSTVRTQVRAIRRKLGVGSQLAATALARETGWFDNQS